MPKDSSEIKIWKKVLAIIAPYNSKRRVFVKMAVQIVAHPRQLVYYCHPQKIIRGFYYLKH